MKHTSVDMSEGNLSYKLVMVVVLLLIEETSSEKQETIWAAGGSFADISTFRVTFTLRVTFTFTFTFIT